MADGSASGRTANTIYSKMQPATNNSTLCNRRTTHNAAAESQPWVASRFAEDASAAPVELAPTFKIAKGEAVGCTLPAPWRMLHSACRMVHGHSSHVATVHMLQHIAPSCSTAHIVATHYGLLQHSTTCSTQYMCSAVRTACCRCTTWRGSRTCAPMVRR